MLLPYISFLASTLLDFFQYIILIIMFCLNLPTEHWQALNGQQLSKSKQVYPRIWTENGLKQVEKVFGTNTNTTFCEFLFFLLFSKGTEGSKGPFCAEVHTLINCIVKNWTDLELHAIWKIAHLPAQSLWRFLSLKIILSQAFFFPLHNPKIVRTKKQLPIKGGFFSESAMCFSNLQISQKKILNHYPELEI